MTGNTFRTILFCILSCFFSWYTHARLIIPKGLTSNDRQNLLEIVGFGTTPKLLANPYTLGGYSGVEVGISTEIVPTSDISRMGDKAPQQSETTYSVLTLGKGIFNNIDTLMQFGLLGNGEEISNFGGQLRWSFLQAEYLPVFLTAVASANSVNIQNMVTTTTQAGDLVLAVLVDDITLYLGAGVVRTQGIFTGGVGGVTDNNQTQKENLAGGHYLAGLNLQFSKVFLAMQIDRYTQATYSAKLGMRF